MGSEVASLARRFLLSNTSSTSALPSISSKPPVFETPTYRASLSYLSTSKSSSSSSSSTISLLLLSKRTRRNDFNPSFLLLRISHLLSLAPSTHLLPSGLPPSLLVQRTLRSDSLHPSNHFLLPLPRQPFLRHSPPGPRRSSLRQQRSFRTLQRFRLTNDSRGDVGGNERRNVGEQ